MSYEKLLKLIDAEPVRAFLDRQRDIIEEIDPERIYVENVRAFFKLPNPAARLLCELAVREGAFERRIGVLCPHDEHIVKSFKTEEEIPERIFCLSCEAEGREECVHGAREMYHLRYYRLVAAANE